MRALAQLSETEWATARESVAAIWATLSDSEQLRILVFAHSPLEGPYREALKIKYKRNGGPSDDHEDGPKAVAKVAANGR